MKTITKMFGVLGMILMLLVVPAIAVTEQGELARAEPTSGGVLVQGNEPDHPSTEPRDVHRTVARDDSDDEKDNVKKLLRKAKRKLLNYQDTEDKMGPVTHEYLLVTQGGTDWFYMRVDKAGYFIGEHYTKDSEGILDFTSNRAAGVWKWNERKDEGVWVGQVYQGDNEEPSLDEAFYGIFKNDRWIAIGMVNGQVVYGDYFYM